MKSWICICLALLFCAFHSHAGQRPQSLVPTKGARILDVPVSTAPPTKAEHSALDLQRSNDESIEWVIPIEVDPGALQHDIMEAFLFDTHVVIRRVEADFPRLHTRSRTRARERWHGEVLLPGDAEGIDHMGLRDADFFIRPNGTVTGHIRIGQLVYTLNRTGAGLYFLTKQDLTKLPKDGDDVFDPETGLPHSELPDQSSFFPVPPFIPNPIPPKQIHTADVVVAFSTKAMRGDLQSFTQAAHDAVELAEDAYWNSGVPLYLNLAAFAQPGYAEVSITRTLSDLRKREDGPLWLAHVARENSSADVIIMVVDGNDSWGCGGVHNIGSTRQTAYMVVRRGCFNYGSVAHELGHLLGAHHNKESLGGLAAKYTYGHGYFRDGPPGMLTGWSTLMTVEEFCTNSCPRVQRFSDPNRKYNGEPMGNSTSNNVRAILLNYGDLANYYPRPQPSSLEGPMPLFKPQGTQWLYE